MVSAKGKEKVSDNGGKGKRKLGGDDDKTGGGKRKNRGVLQFFDDSAYQVDDDEDSSDESMFDVDDFFEDEFDSDLKFNNEPGKVPKVPELPFVKEEEMSEEEVDRMFENRYKPGAGFVTYAEDGYEHKTSVDKDMYVPSAKDPTIWKVKCMVGRERYSAFCLMQKYVDLEYLGTKLQIISAFALDHVKGFIFIEAEKQNNIYEACNGLCTIYPTRVAPVPNNEMSRLLSARSKSNAISVGTWARVKSGKYKGDLAQVVAVNDARKKVTAKLIPRIDLKAMAEKIGGGVSAKRSVIPPQRLISSSELDEFRPLIHCRKDRDTNEMVEVLDGMILKDGYLYKKIPIDSLSFWGVMPTEAELLKFEPSKKDESTDVQWLSQLFGEKKKKPVETAKLDKGNGKSDGSSSSTITGNNFELHDLVFFGRKDFGVVIGSEKDGSIKVIKEGSVVVTVKQSELKSASFDKKLFSVLDQHSKTISINDIVRVKNGQLKDRQGVVKKIYKGVLFLFDGSDDESEQENNGYICVKAQLCEKISGEPSHEKGSEPGPSGCADLFSSPQSPLSPDKSYEEKDNKSSFKRDDDAMFSVGQSLRIRMGPLKGYRCRVLAVRRSDVTVKLDSQQKILTVKSENLSEVHGRNPAISQGEESLSTKPFDFLGTQGGGSDWTSGAALSTEGTAWNAGASTERTSWSALDPSNSSLSKEPGSIDPADDNAKKGTEVSSWQTKPTSNENSSWGAAAVDKKQDPQAGQVSGWGTNGGWNQATSSVAVNSGAASWGKAVIPDADVPAETRENSSWGVLAKKSSIGGDTSGSKSAWGQSNASPKKKAGGWGNASGDTAVTSESQWGNCGDMKKDGSPSWGKGSESLSEGGASGQTKNWDTKNGGDDQNDSWNKPKSVAVDSGTAWGKPERTSSWNKKDVGSTDERNKEDGWKKPNVSGENKESGQNQGWNANKGSPESGKEWGIPKSDGENRSPGWKNSKGSNTGNASCWGSASIGNGEAGKGKGSWGKETKQNDNNKSSWNTGTTSLEGSPKGNWGSQKASEVNNSGWNQNAKDGQGDGSWKDGNNVGGGSPTGWGNKSNWGKSGTDNGNGNQESSWSNKSNWKSGGGFSENNNQDDSSNDRGGGGGWRGRGGRGGDRGGFRGGRGGSDFGGNQESTWSSKSSWSSRGGFGDNNNSQDDSSNDRGRGGRWSGGRDDRGSFRGRGGSDGGRFGGGRGGGDGEGGFRGRGGGFRGRGRGDWNNNRGGGDSNTEGGWKSNGGGSSWNQTGNDNNNQHQSWNRPSEGGGSWNQGGGGDRKPSQGWGSSTAQDGEWGKSKGVDCSKDLGGASGWGSTNASSPKESHGGWNKPSPKKESGGGWNNKANESANQNKIEGPATTWGAAPGSVNSSGNWGKSEKDEGPSNTTWGGGGSGKW